MFYNGGNAIAFGVVLPNSSFFRRLINGFLTQTFVIQKLPFDAIEIILLSADILRRSPKTIDLAYNLAARADGLAPGALRTTQLLRKILEKMGRTDEAEKLSLRLQGWNRKPGRFSSRIDRIQPAASLWKIRRGSGDTYYAENSLRTSIDSVKS